MTKAAQVINVCFLQDPVHSCASFFANSSMEN